MSEFASTLSTVDDRSRLHNESSVEGYITSDADTQRIMIIAIVMAFTLVGNMVLILVLLCKRSRRKKRVNILLLNLAFGDLAVAMFVNSTEILFLAFGDWSLGPVLCKISVYVQMVCLSSATNLLTAMSIDRYQVLVKPMQSLARRSWIWLKICVAWTLSLLFPIPQLFIFVQDISGLKYDGSPRRVCGSRGYTARWQRKVYFTYTTVYILIVPMIIMLFCYIKIIKVVWIRAQNETRRQNHVTPPLSSSTPARSSPIGGTDRNGIQRDCQCGCATVITEDARKTKNNKWTQKRKGNSYSTNIDSYNHRTYGHQDKDSEDSNPGSPRMSVRRGLVSASKRRVLTMTLTVVVSFLVCLTPYFCINLSRIYSDYKLTMEIPNIVSEFMVMIHSTLNPILYGLFALREYHIKQLFALLTCTSGSISQRRRRFGKYSDERHELLTNVRFRLVTYSNKGHTSTVIARDSNNSNTHANPLIEYSPKLESSSRFECINKHAQHSEPLPSISILKMIRSKSIPRLTRKIKLKQQHKSDTILFVNNDAMESSNRNNEMVGEIEQPELNVAFSLSHSASQVVVT